MTQKTIRELSDLMDEKDELDVFDSWVDDAMREILKIRDRHGSIHGSSIAYITAYLNKRYADYVSDNKTGLRNI